MKWAHCAKRLVQLIEDICCELLQRDVKTAWVSRRWEGATSIKIGPEVSPNQVVSSVIWLVVWNRFLFNQIISEKIMASSWPAHILTKNSGGKVGVWVLTLRGNLMPITSSCSYITSYICSLLSSGFIRSYYNLSDELAHETFVKHQRLLFVVVTYYWPLIIYFYSWWIICWFAMLNSHCISLYCCPWSIYQCIVLTV